MKTKEQKIADFKRKQMDEADQYGYNILVAKKIYNDLIAENAHTIQDAELVQRIFVKLGFDHDLDKRDLKFIQSLDSVTRGVIEKMVEKRKRFYRRIGKINENN